MTDSEISHAALPSRHPRAMQLRAAAAVCIVGTVALASYILVTSSGAQGYLGSESGQGVSLASAWSADSGQAPFVSPIAMWADPKCVDHTGPANNVRRILGLRTSWHYHMWNTNNFVNDLNSAQLTFFARQEDAVLVIPPFHQFPEVSPEATATMNSFILVGGNTLLVVGGPTGVLFINQYMTGGTGYGYNLETKWTNGPYEMQDAAYGTPFQYGAVTLPAVDTYNVGVWKDSLPKEAVTYYAVGDVSVVFSIPAEAGQIVYVGYTYTEMVPAWTDVLLLAMRFHREHKAKQKESEDDSSDSY